MDAFEMMMRACGIAVTAALCLTLIGGAGGYAFALRTGGAVLLFGIFMLLFGESIDAIRRLSEGAYASEFATDAFDIMLKGLGVALLCRFCSDICRDCGENTLASGVESVGKIVIFSLSLPMLADILTLAREILGAGA